MSTRRDFLKKAGMFSASAALINSLPDAITRALSIDPAIGSTFMDAEHVVILMQENRSFDHAYGTLRGVRGYNDPRAIRLPNGAPVWMQTNAKGESFLPFRLDLKNTKSTWMSSLPHAWADQVDARNNGRYDQWLQAKASGNKEFAEMPLTVGYYNREDIPFYYDLADSFTICDQHFCSSLTGTTPNRLYLWTGTIREKEDANALARVWNEDADLTNMVNWKTFPERLEDWGVTWKVYQNEIYADTGFEGEEESWLSNFGDNSLEYFTQFHVKLSPRYIKNLPVAEKKILEELATTEKLLTGTHEAEKAAAKKTLSRLKEKLSVNRAEQKKYTIAAYNNLSPAEKQLHQKAFTLNEGDKEFRTLEDLSYNEQGKKIMMKAPKGDVLYQFRKDVDDGKLPAVSWLAAPENFSDHPSAAWYGAWYISEVMNILTKNEEVWKKTIFILTYDENDGYFDHCPPFVAPKPNDPSTGKCSAGIDTSMEYVANNNQQSIADAARISPIGLGYRVPMIIASPWSRGGWVNSQVFDHTSCLQLLEKWLSQKTKKEVREPNISEWRRTVCGDLSSAFRPFDGKKEKLSFVKREEFLESIHAAKNKKLPTGYRKLTASEKDDMIKGRIAAHFHIQEKGIRDSCALPYELGADGRFSKQSQHFDIQLTAGDEIFGAKSVGAPFKVYNRKPANSNEQFTRDYAVKAGDRLTDSWDLRDPDLNPYDLEVHGPNGFYRHFTGNYNDPVINILCFTNTSGDLILAFDNQQNFATEVTIDNTRYGGKKNRVILPPSYQFDSTRIEHKFSTTASHGWYDLRVSNEKGYLQHFAGRVETGKHSKSDPLM